MKCFVPETGGHRILGSFHLFPQQCLLLTPCPIQHIEAVHNKLREVIMVLSKKRQQRFQKSSMKSLAMLAMDIQHPKSVATKGDKPIK